MADLNLFIDRDSVQPPERPEPEVVKETVIREELTGIHADIFDFVDEFAEEITGEKEPIQEVSPPGWGHTKGPEEGGSAEAFDNARKEGRFKGSKEDMFAIMWASKNKGDKTHYKPKSNPPEKKKGSLKENYEYIDKSAERVTQFLGDTGKTVKREIAPLEERYELLEAKINKIQQITKSMFPGNPGNTIVSGIGNSGDGSTQGGGAVWLWDLDDVSIGTPLNGVYPTITDGDVLKYSAGDGKWIAGEGAQANILEGGIINANGGTANTTGNVVLQATTVTNGNLEIQKISSDPTVKIYGATGNTDFKGGFVQIDRLAVNSSIGQSNFTIHGRRQDDITNGTPSNTGDVFYNYTSHPQDTGTADAMQYAGRISQSLDIVNKGYVDSAIDTGGGGIGFTFKGTCDVTLPLDNAANSDVVEAEGNFYINITGGTAYNSGTAAQNWKGIGGLAISADQLIIWSESSDRWFAGAVENDTTFVKVDGSNPMTGGLTIAPSSGSNGLVIKDGSTTNITLFKGGSISLTNTLTVGTNIIPDSANTGNVGTETAPFSEVNSNKLFAYADGSQFAAFGPYGTTPTIGGTNTRFGTVYCQAINSNQTSTMASIFPQVLGNNLGGSSSLNNRWQHICGVVANFSGTGTEASVFGDINPSSNLLRNLGTSSVSWSNLYLSSANVNVVKPLGAAGVKFGTTTAAAVTDTGAQNVGGTYNFQGGKTANTIFHRCTDNDMTVPQWIIKGKTDANDGVKTNNLLAVYRSTGNTADYTEYTGGVTTSKSLVNKNYVDTGGNLYAAITGGSVNNPPWETNLSKYRIRGGQVDIQIYVEASGGVNFSGTNFLNIGTLPTAAKPPSWVAQSAVAIPANTSVPHHTPLLVTVDTSGSVRVWAPATSITPQRMYARFSFPLGS